MPDSSLSKSVFAKHNHIVDTYLPAARVRSGSALSKTFPVRMCPSLSTLSVLTLPHTDSSLFRPISSHPARTGTFPSRKNHTATPGMPQSDPSCPPLIPASLPNAAPFSVLAFQLWPAQLSRHPQLIPTSMLPQTTLSVFHDDPRT
jgi:hypothetical protein